MLSDLFVTEAKRDWAKIKPLPAFAFIRQIAKDMKRIDLNDPNNVAGLTKFNVGVDIDVKSAREVYMFEMRSETKGAGNAKKFLDYYTKLADKLGVTLTLNVVPFDVPGEPAVDFDRLDKLYRKYGFVPNPGGDEDSRIRKPKGTRESIDEAGPSHTNMYTHVVKGNQQVVDLGKHGRFHGYSAMPAQGADPKKILSLDDYKKGLKDGSVTADPIIDDFDIPYFLKQCSKAMDDLKVPQRDISVVVAKYPHGGDVSGWMYPGQLEGPIYLSRTPSSTAKSKYGSYKGHRSPHTLLHEYAHVIWYKDLSKAQQEAIKAYWLANVKGNKDALANKISPSPYGITGGDKAASHPWTEWWPEIAGYSMYGSTRLNPVVEKFAKDLLSGKVDATPAAGPEKQTIATPAPATVEPDDANAKKVKALLAKYDGKVKKLAGDYQVQYRPDKTIRLIPSKGAHDMSVLAQIAQLLKFDKHADLPLRARYSTGSQGGLVMYAEGVDIEAALTEIREEDLPFVLEAKSWPHASAWVDPSGKVNYVSTHQDGVEQYAKDHKLDRHAALKKMFGEGWIRVGFVKAGKTITMNFVKVPNTRQLNVLQDLTVETLQMDDYVGVEQGETKYVVLSVEQFNKAKSWPQIMRGMRDITASEVDLAGTNPDTPREEDRMSIIIEAGKPVGKAQQALHDVLQGNPDVHELSDLARRKEFHGVHFKQIMSAAKALSSKGLINYDGTSKVSWKMPVEHVLVSENVAKEIQSQIGNKALFMIGAKQFVDHGDGLSFRIGRNKINANIIKITYRKGQDDYVIEFMRARGVDLKTLKTVAGVYAEDLTKIIGDTTGLAVQMPTVKFSRKDEGVEEAGTLVSHEVEFGTHDDAKQAVSALRKVGATNVQYDAQAKRAIVKFKAPERLRKQVKAIFQKTDAMPLSTPWIKVESVDEMTEFKVGDKVVAPPGKMVGTVVKVSPMKNSSYTQTVTVKWRGGSTKKHANQSLRLAESVDEVGVYAHPAVPPKFNAKKQQMEPTKGPWKVNIDLYTGADVEALMAAFDSDDETDWPMKKSEYGFGLQLTVDAKTRKDAEELVRATLVRYGWAEKEPPDTSMGGMYVGSPVNPVMASEAIGKKTQGEVMYQTTPGPKGERCGDCAYVSLPEACKKVEGKISQDGYCNLWKRGIAS